MKLRFQFFRKIQMKVLTLSFLAFLFWSNSCVATIDSFFIKRFRKIVRLIESDKAQELSKFVNYPLKRGNPLPDIKSPNDFIAQFHLLFDKAFKDLLKEYNDSLIFEHNYAYGLVGGNFSGEIWIDEDGKISAINYSSKKEQEKKQTLIQKIKKEMHSTVNTWDENVLVAKSEKFLVRIDRTSKGLRYVYWSKGRTMKDSPDIILYDGIEEPQGTMGGWTWTFRNGDWTYVVNDTEICDEPKNCGLFLELFFKGELKTTTGLKEIK
jgi:hypothetical protein